MNHPALRDTALLLLRAALGVSFIAHGWNRMFLQGMAGPTGTVEIFTSAGVPAPQAVAWVAAVVEMVGGALLIVGLLATAAAGILAVWSAVELYFFHLGRGFFAIDGGVELPLITIGACLAVLVFGSGRASLDRALSRFA
ncbi:DoxX family protein [Corynebacterium urogenitale]